jgi:hypothetical protein
MKGAYEYLMDRFLGNGTSSNSDALVLKGLELTDFFASEFNSKDSGFLMAEFMPPEIDGLPKDMEDFSYVEGSVTTDKDSFSAYKKDVPCVRLDDVVPLLPECKPDKDEPVRLEDFHCEAAFDEAREDILDYAASIETTPMKSTAHRFVVRVCL